jgi:hypothetical protein
MLDSAINRKIPAARQGIVSLLSLIIMTAVTATAVGTASLILNELRQSESLDQSFSAVYAAESGLEDGLFIVKDTRATETLAATQSFLDNPEGRAPIPTLASWQRQSDLENQFLVARLQADATASLDLFNPDDPSGASGMESIIIQWSANCNSYFELETTVTSWEVGPSGVTFGEGQRVYKTTNACNQAAGSHTCQDIVLNAIDAEDFSASRPYRFSFRPLVPLDSACNVENLTVKAYNAIDGGGSVVDFPTRVQIKSTGTFSRSKQALTASIPWRAPVSGLFGFVIFSDVGITK